MIAVLKFDLPKDAQELEDARIGTKLRRLVDEFDEYIRSAAPPVGQVRDEIQITWDTLKKKHLS